MKPLDDFEQRIIKQLVKNPRISDNQISKITKIPVKTVNRKRKKLEEEGVLTYTTIVNYGTVGVFGTTQLYLVIFKEGVTKKSLVDFLNSIDYNTHLIKHIDSCFVGEFEGNSTIVFIIQSRLDKDVVEIFNADIVSMINSKFGSQAIKDVKVLRINDLISLNHNYLVTRNMHNGRIKPDWPDDKIFVTD